MNSITSDRRFAEDDEDTARVVSTIVGIGASAGGLKALETLFDGISSGTGMAFVVVQHLSPTFNSLMDEILSRHTKMRVINAADGMELKPDCVFLITPGKNLSVRDGRLRLTAMDREQIQKPVDLLFRSLAQSFGSRAVGVVLSGTGNDGSAGIRELRQCGGTTVVQSPETAQFNGMPSNAIATHCVDLVLPPEEISRFLNRFPVHREGRITVEEFSSDEELTGVNLVFSLLCERYGIDFADYKPSTIARRIDRRIHATNSPSLQAYADKLQGDNVELDALYHDLLIGVTKFFRDTEAFLAFEGHLRQVVRRLPVDTELRIWVAGCATGEEAYSLGMLAVDAFERCGREVKIKILATDVHQAALDTAARGVYSGESLEFVSQERQSAFFAPVDSHQYRVRSEIRRHIVFARHNVLQDPPFTRMHIVTCRNMLIYLQPNAQQSAIASFHFALEPDGLLMLGSSETLGRLQDEFDTLDNTWRIYRKLRNLPRLIAGNSVDAESIARGPRRLVNILNRDKPDQLSFTSLLEAYDLLLAQFIDCGLLLDENRNILHTFGNAHRFLHNSAGRFTGNVARLLGGDARTVISAGLVRAAREPQARFVLRNVSFDVNGDSLRADVTIRALQGKGARVAWFVEFTSGTDAVSQGKVEDTEVRITQAGDDYSSLEAELTYTKESLSATIEELEASNEELQSTNEELVASNEELQSTNEELHSVNEELYSVNAENHRKITELQEVTEDIENLLRSTDIGTVFVDADQRIRRFTEAATRFFNLVDHDIGRPLANFTHSLAIRDLPAAIRTVLAGGQPYATRTQAADGHDVLVRIIPYVSGDENKGAILYLVDLDAMRAD
ncbi:MAG: chemotaxis protein CheB [Planctomycetaceae bacterium]